jgi:hypothetical protein
VQIHEPTILSFPRPPLGIGRRHDNPACASVTVHAGKASMSAGSPFVRVVSRNVHGPCAPYGTDGMPPHCGLPDRSAFCANAKRESATIRNIRHIAIFVEKRIKLTGSMSWIV